MAKIGAMEWARRYYAADSIRHNIGEDAKKFVSDNPGVKVEDFITMRDAARTLTDTLQKVAAYVREKEGTESVEHP